MTTSPPKTIGDLNKVPEFLLKKRKLKTDQRQKQERKTKLQIAKNVRQRKQPKPSDFKRLEYFVERANRREWERLRILKEARKAIHMQESNIDNLPKSESNSDNPVIVIIRICRQHKVSKAGKKLLKDFRLSKIYNASLFRLDQDLLYKLTILKENVVWGFINKDTVKNLILKKGRTGTLKNPEPLNNNLKIEQALGHKDIICLEDLVFELTKEKSDYDGEKSTAEEKEESMVKFQLCRNYMLPFALSMPEGGKRAVSNFVDKELRPGFRKEGELKELLVKMV